AKADHRQSGQKTGCNGRHAGSIDDFRQKHGNAGKYRPQIGGDQYEAQTQQNAHRLAWRLLDWRRRNAVRLSVDQRLWLQYRLAFCRVRQSCVRVAHDASNLSSSSIRGAMKRRTVAPALSGSPEAMASTIWRCASSFGSGSSPLSVASMDSRMDAEKKA